MKQLVEAAYDEANGTSSPMTIFQPFDLSSELWLDYLERVRTFFTVNSIPKEKELKYFVLTRLQCFTS